MSATTFWIVLVLSNPACLFLGFLFGRVTRATVEIEERVMSTEEEVDPDSAEVRDVPKTAIRQRITALRVSIAVTCIVGIVTAVLGVVVTRNQDRLTGCVVGYSNASSAAIKASRAAQNEVNNNLDRIFEAVLVAFSADPTKARQELFDAVSAYNKSRTEAKRSQRENPLPDPPEDACAELLD